MTALDFGAQEFVEADPRQRAQAERWCIALLLAQVTERPTEEVLAALRGLAAEYDEAGRGFELRQVAGGWRFYTRASCAA
mgnify:CR=1 FL=1